MIFERKEIGKGIFFNYIHKDKFKSSYVKVSFIMPLEKEANANNTLAFQMSSWGTEKYKDILSLKKQYNMNYDSPINLSNVKRGDNQIISISMNILDPKYTYDGYDTFSSAMDIMDQYIFHPYLENGKYRKEILEKQIKKNIDALNSNINNKGKYASIRCAQEMFANDIFSIYVHGDENEMKRATVDSVYNAYQKILSTSAIEIFVCGNIDYDMALSKFSSMFSDLERKDIYKMKTNPYLQTKDSEYKKVYDHFVVNQGKLSLCFSTVTTENDESVYAMKVFNNIFGGGTMSKLFMNVREKMSLCYYCSSSYNDKKGYIQVNSGIKFEDEDIAFNEIMNQLHQIQKGNITKEELQSAKADFYTILESVDDDCAFTSEYYFDCILKGKIITPEELKKKYESVTKKQIIEEAKKLKLETYYFLCAGE